MKSKNRNGALTLVMRFPALIYILICLADFILLTFIALMRNGKAQSETNVAFAPPVATPTMSPVATATKYVEKATKNRTPTAAPTPTASVKNKTLTPVNSIGPIMKGDRTNPIVFEITFEAGVRKKEIFDSLSVIIKSDIVKLVYKQDDLKLEKTNKKNAKRVNITVPVIGEYKVSLQWNNKDIKKRHFFHNVTSLDAVPKDYSTLVCYGDKYESRWCRARNICYSDRWFTFFGVPEATKFNRSIMTPGSRPIPMDYPSCRKSIRFRVTKNRFPPRNAAVVVKDRLSYVTCRWFSMQYLWHSLFDYTLPLFWTQKLNGGTNKSCKIYTIDENTSQKGFQFIKAYTDGDVKMLRVNETENNNTCWHDVVLGFPKSEYVVTPEKWNSTMELPYEYPLEAYKGFREHMITHYCGSDVMKNECEPDPKNPRVVVVFRNSQMRDIDNKQELVDAVQQWCPHCRVDAITFQNQTYGEQMRSFCNASIMISMHGSQLSHMVWMKIDDPNKPTSVIEILPYLYTCRDWYEQIANGAQIKYFKWINTHRNNTRSGRKPNALYERCLNGEKSCLEDCHDYLRDQPTIVNLTEFEAVFRKSLAYVSK